MDIKTVTRTSAVIYADGMSERKTNTIRRKFVEAVFVQNNNTALTLLELGNALDDLLNLQFDDADIKELLEDNSIFNRVLAKHEDQTKYLLIEERYKMLAQKSEVNIESSVERYIVDNRESILISPDDFRSLLVRYLYALLNSNIAAYSQVLNPNINKDNANGRVVPEDFSDEEIILINQFIAWRDDLKNKELYKLVSLCVEYAIVVNNSSEQILINSLKNKSFYLDNSLLYRAIGINGENRRKRTLSFIRKCNESGQRLYISKYTREEFLDTIDFHLAQLGKSTPFGNINPMVFKRYANGEGFYQYYHQWREKKLAYGFEVFKAHILLEYRNLLATYHITEDFTIPFQEDDAPIIKEYQEQIKSKKSKGNEVLHHNDACNMYWIECKRAGKDYRINDTRFYFITSDQKLQSWDLEHSKNQPITLLPSQWMVLLLKYVSRTNDDYNSFVSFLNMPQNKPSISPDELQTIMAGISEVTENFKMQTDIVEALFEADWRNILKNAPRTSAKEYAKDRLEQEYINLLIAKDKESQVYIEGQTAAYNEAIKELSESYEEKFVEYKKRADEMIAEQEQHFREAKLTEIDRQLQELLLLKKNADQAITHHYYMLKMKILFVFLSVVAVYVGVVIGLGWDRMEIVTWLVSVFLTIGSAFYFIVYEKKFSIDKALKRFHDQYTTHFYNLFMYSDEKFRDLEETKSILSS